MKRGGTGVRRVASQTVNLPAALFHRVRTAVPLQRRAPLANTV